LGLADELLDGYVEVMFVKRTCTELCCAQEP
jgi:hypothetical protein